MRKNIFDAISQCNYCQRLGKPIKNEILQPIPVPSEPWTLCGLDIKHCPTSRSGMKYIIACADYTTKWIEARAVRLANATEVALFIYEEIISRHSQPKAIIVDNGLPVSNNIVKEVCKQFSMELHTCSVYTPTSNGFIERLNQVLGRLLKKRPKHEIDDWCQYLPAALFAYRTIKQNSTKQSPFKLLYFREAMTPFDRIMEDTSYIGDDNEEWSLDEFNKKLENQINKLQNVRRQAAASIEVSQHNQRKTIERKILAKKKHLIQPPFNIGDTVLVYNNAIETSWSGKLEQTWLGPYIVDSVNDNAGYKLKTLQGVKLKDTIHGNRLWIYKVPDVKFQPTYSVTS